MSAAPMLAHTLGAVSDRLETRAAGLAALWAELSHGRGEAIGEDIPALVAGSLRGGKRVRPAMVHWGWVAAGAPAEAHDDVVTLGAALELLHVFALIHDDVMDRSELRRGQPSVFARARDAHAAQGAIGSSRDHGDHVAILVGDLVHAEADHLVAGLPADVRRAWRAMVVELVLGQYRDITGAALGRRDLEQAREVSRLKTGAYTVQRPLELGALLGGAAPEVVSALLEFGWNVGEAFGLRDDVLGIWGDPALTGKSNDDDLVAGKATVVLALAAGRLDEASRALLARTGTPELGASDLAGLHDALTASGIRDDVEALVATRIEQAAAALATADIPAPAVVGLTHAAHQIAWRQS